jgi:hypothetical protein
MFQSSLLIDPTLVIEHRHSDGTWGRMEPEPEPHDSAEHDPERRWQFGRIFRCKTCDEQVRIRPAASGPLNESD